MFMQQTGVRARHVPYQQFPQATADLLNGTNQFMFIAITPVIGLIQSGKLRALAVTAPHRIPILPDVPTAVEEGFPGLVAENWLGFAVKNGTADAIVRRLNEAVNRALAKPKIREAIDRMGAEPIRGIRSNHQIRSRTLDPGGAGCRHRDEGMRSLMNARRFIRSPRRRAS
jgi:tripartite-type tricarboxylate transporter receptor subunit TctC